MLPADEALEFSVEYAGVTVFAQMHVLEIQEDKKAVMQLIMRKYAPHLQSGEDYREIMPEELERTAVFKLSIQEWSAKKKVVEKDFPCAYSFSEMSYLNS